MLGMDPVPGVQITLISRDVETPYSGMLPGFVAGYYSRSECHIDLCKLSSFAGARLLHTEVTGLDVKNKVIHCKDGRPPVRYDVLSIDIGISPKHELSLSEDERKMWGVTPVKPIDGFARRWDDILSRVIVGSNATSNLRVCVVGGGGGGTELCFAINHRLKQELVRANKDPSSVEVVMITRGLTVMSEHNVNVQTVVTRLLKERGIRVEFGAEIVAVTLDSTDSSKQLLVAADGRTFHYTEAIWCTQATAQPWLGVAGLAVTDQGGFVCVKPTLESVNVRNVFASGDVAHLVDNPRPKAGVFAVRAGPPLLANIRLRLMGQEELAPWVPQSEFLGIIGTGSGRAVASKGPLALEGEYLWKLKDKIDRIWMAGYQELPDVEAMMASKAATASSSSSSKDNITYDRLVNSLGGSTIEMLSKAQMRCGGCGSKVGSQVISRALKKVSKLNHQREEVKQGISDDAALVTPPPAPFLMVHTVDYFRSFISDPFLFGQIAANHSLSDVHAMNGRAISALAICVLQYGPEAFVEEQLVHMLSGATKMLSADECSLVGGHTAEGTDLALGVSVNGVVHPDEVLHKGPVLAGQLLVLTKAIGTGALMAANMRARAAGHWVVEAQLSMLQSNAPAARLIFQHGCTACTDVTGFGLAGHLLEMLTFDDGEDDAADNAQVAATIDLSLVPVLPGALECVKSGVLSSLHPENIRCARAIDNVELGAGDFTYPLMFDPQTAGGLLTAVSADRAEALVEALRAAGYARAAVIGSVVPRQRGEFSSLIFLEKSSNL